MYLDITYYFNFIFLTPDHPLDITANMPLPLVGFLQFLTIFSFLLQGFVLIVLIIYRKSRLLKASQIAMVWIILVSSMLSCARITGASVSVSFESCEGNYWFGHATFISIIGFFAKTLRVQLIVRLVI